MKYYKEYEPFFGDIVGDRKKVDNTIYSFDIETTSYIKLDGKIMQANQYLELSKDEQEQAEFKSCMYIWMFSINDIVYYGRTWDEFKKFLEKLEFYNSNKKIVFIHNLAFEFQYLKSVFKFKNLIARTAKTKLTTKELGYCEFDCLVVYHYIRRELETYERVDKIPLTSTGHVRRELKELVSKDWDYKRKVKKAINVNPHIFNLLQEAFDGRLYKC